MISFIRCVPSVACELCPVSVCLCLCALCAMRYVRVFVHCKNGSRPKLDFNINAATFYVAFMDELSDDFAVPIPNTTSRRMNTWRCGGRREEGDGDEEEEDEGRERDHLKKRTTKLAYILYSIW